MIRVQASINLFPDGRKIPFTDGYRPHFTFSGNHCNSGMIHLGAKKSFAPGERGVVDIYLVSEQLYKENLGPGKHFVFSEGLTPIGDGTILAVELNPTLPVKNQM